MSEEARTVITAVRIHHFDLPHGGGFSFHHADGHPLLKVLKKAQARWLRLQETETSRFRKEAKEQIEISRSLLATWLGVIPEQLLLVPSVRSAMAFLPRILGLRANEEFLATDEEYVHLIPRWRTLCRDFGVPYRELSVRELLTNGFPSRSRVFCLSHITSLSSQILPVERLCCEARSQGIITVVDGANSVGQISVRPSELGADYYVGGLHKWFGLPYGSAFLFCKEPPPPKVRWLETGLGKITISHLLIKTLLDFQAELGHPTSPASPELRKLASERLGWPLLEVDEPAPQMATCLLPKEIEFDRLNHHLATWGFDGIVLHWRKRPILRLCFSPYHDSSDVLRLAKALERFRCKR